MASFALTFIRITHADNGTLIDEATQAFTKDFATFARSNNRADLESATKELKKTPKDKAYANAVTEGYKAANLVTGYIGAKTGKFDAQADEVKATFNDAIDRFSEAFKASLVESGAFIAPATKSQADKDKAKQDKADKADKAKSDLITAMVQAGEIVRSADIKTIKDMSVSALVGELLNRLPADLRYQEADIRSLLSMAVKGNDDYADAFARAEAAETAAIAAMAETTAITA